MFLSKQIKQVTIVVLKSLDYPATPSCSHGLLQQRGQQHWTTVQQCGQCFKTFARAHPNVSGTLLLYRAFSFSPLPPIYLEKKEGVPLKSKASQREGLGRSARSNLHFRI